MTFAITWLEHILESGDAGEILGGGRGENGEEPPDCGYNAALIWTFRYLLPGPDTEAVYKADIDWSNWPMMDGTMGAQRHKLPDRWHVMPKGLLMNYFRICGDDIKAREEAEKAKRELHEEIDT